MKKVAHLTFSHFLGIGPVKFQLLLERFQDPEKALSAPQRKLAEVLGPDLASKFCIFRKSFDGEAKLNELEGKGILMLPQDDLRYPTPLLQIPDPPICVYVKGDLSQFSFEHDVFVGIVGTRVPSSYGFQITKKFSSELSVAGAVIVSGLALGVDGAAHEAALDSGGRTIAFVGCGVDIIYPPRHTKLYERMMKGNGLVISEFPPGHTVLPGLFVSRNRLISGLSKGIVLIEGLKTSGGLLTARYAAIQGKEVFAPPVPLTSRLSEAPNILLKQGATLVMSAEDIMENLQISYGTSPMKNYHLSEEEQKIHSLLQNEQLSADDIAEKTAIPIVTLLSLLTTMELTGSINKNMDGTYSC